MVKTMELIDYIKRITELETELEQTQNNLLRDAPVLVKEARHQLGLTQRGLADRLGVNHTYLSKIENGHMRPGMPTLRKLAELMERE